MEKTMVHKNSKFKNQNNKAFVKFTHDKTTKY